MACTKCTCPLCAPPTAAERLRWPTPRFTLAATLPQTDEAMLLAAVESLMPQSAELVRQMIESARAQGAERLAALIAQGFATCVDIEITDAWQSRAS